MNALSTLAATRHRTIQQLKASLLPLMLWVLGGTLALAQPAGQNFGTTAGALTTATSSTTLIPAPTNAGAATTYARIGAGGGSINLESSDVLGTTGMIVRGVAPTGTSINKVTPMHQVGGATSTAYVKTRIMFGGSTVATTASSGIWYMFMGNGATYGDATAFSSTQTFTGFRFTFGASGAITTNHRGAGSWVTTATLLTEAIRQRVTYTLEVVANNTAAPINYTYDGVTQSVSAGTQHIYLNGAYMGQLVQGQLSVSTVINSLMFYGESSISNAANIYIDDVEFHKAIPVAITSTLTAPTPHDLSVSDYTFTSWPNTSTPGTYPASMRFRYLERNIINPLLANATATRDYQSDYRNLSQATRVTGRDIDGISFVNARYSPIHTQSTPTSGNLGEAIVALDATGRNNLQATWTAARVGTSTKVYELRAQYRVGNTGAFTDLPGGTFTSSDAGPTTLGPITLPADADNQPLVQVRWAYVSAAAGTEQPADEIRLDDITITSSGSTTAPPVINSSLTATGQVGTPASYTITASNSPTSFDATGLPPGLTVNTATGVISGTPTTTVGSPFSVSISATNADGTDTRTLVYTINPAPCTPATAITTQPTGASLAFGQAYTLSVTASGQGTLTYQWRRNGIDIPSATGTTYQITSAAAGDAGTYVVVVTGGCGPLTSSTATITVAPPDFLNLTAPNVPATENFDGMGTAASATLPTGFGYQQGTATTLTLTTSQQASSGTPATGAYYNWGRTTTDRSPGIMGSTGFAGDRSIVAKVRNNTGAPITAFILDFDYYQFRRNSTAQTFVLQYSTDLATGWVAVPDGDFNNLQTGTSVYGFTTPVATRDITGLVYSPAAAVAVGQDVYFRWVFNAQSNSNGVGIDNFSISGGASCTAPTTQVSALSATSVTSTTASLSWTAGNGEGRIVILSTSPTITAPTNGSNPTASLTYTSGQQVIFNGTGTGPVTVTGLVGGTTYHVRAFEYCSPTRAYQTATATDNPISFLTPIPVTVPTVTTDLVTAITDVQASTGGNVTADGNATVTERGVVWSTAINPTVPSPNSTTDGTGTGAFSSTLTGLEPQTLYNARAYATNSEGTAYGVQRTLRTLSRQPLTQAVDLLATPASSSSVELTWDAAEFAPTGATVSGYVLLRATAPAVPVFSAGNGQAPAASTGVIVTSTVLAPSALFNNTGLSPNTTYNYLLVPYSWDGTNAATYHYLTAGAPTATATTPDGPCTPPGTQVSAATFSVTTPNQTVLAWSGGSGDRTLIVIRAGQAVTATPVSGTEYAANLAFGAGESLSPGQFVIVAGPASASPATVTGLAPSTTYHISLFTFDQATLCYRGTPLTRTVTTPAAGALVETFEPSVKGSYAAGPVTGVLGQWQFVDALIGSAAGSDRFNGTRSARIQNTGSITTLFDITNGIGTVTVRHGRFGTDANSSWRLQVSNNGGLTWTAFQSDQVTTSTTALATEVITVNLTGTLRARIIKQAGGGERLSIDDIEFTPFAPTNTLTTGTVTGSPFCLTGTGGQPVSVPFTSTGTYAPDNVYTAQLSDASGSFSNPIVIGTLTSDAPSGTINATIPAGTPTGTGYRIRTLASSPEVLGSQTTASLVVYLGTPNVSSLNASVTSGTTLTLNWANPLGCFDEVLVVARAGSAVTATPSGDGSSYSPNLAFGTAGSEANLPAGEFALYRGTAQTVNVTNLTAGQIYFVRVYVRQGTTWSQGIQITTTPIDLLVGDMRSIIGSGNWNQTTSWERWNGSNWVGATATPNNGVNVIIRSGSTITLTTSVGSSPIGNLTVNVGGKLFANDSTVNGNRYIAVYGDITCNGMIGNGLGPDGKPFYDNISFNLDGVVQTISGVGSFSASRIRKNDNVNTVTNVTIAMNVGLRFRSGTTGNASGTVMYNAQSGTDFNLTLNEGSSLGLFTSGGASGNLSFDGIDGQGSGEIGGSITVNGMLTVEGSMFVLTNNNTRPVAYRIGPAGTINCVNVLTGNTANASLINGSTAGTATLSIAAGGRLRLTGGSPADLNSYNKPFSLRNNTASPYTYVAGLGQNAFQIYTFEPGSIVEYASTSGTMPIQTQGLTYSNLEISGGAISTLASELVIGRNLTIRSPGILNASGQRIRLSGNWSNYAATGFVESPGAPVEFEGTALQTITTPGGEAFARMEITNPSAQGVQLVGDLTVAERIVFGPSSRLSLGATPSILRLTDQSTGSVGLEGPATATLDLTGPGHRMFLNTDDNAFLGTFIPGTTSTVTYARDAALSTTTGNQALIGGVAYANLTLSGSDTKTPAGDLTVLGNLTIDGPATQLSAIVPRLITLEGDLSLEGGAQMPVAALDNLSLLLQGTRSQQLFGRGASLRLARVDIVKSAGTVSLNAADGTTTLEIGGDLRADLTGTALLRDLGNRIEIGDDAEIGGPSATPAMFEMTGTLAFTGRATANEGERHLSNLAVTGPPRAVLGSLEHRAGELSTVSRLDLYPIAGGDSTLFSGSVTMIAGPNNSTLRLNSNRLLLGGNWTSYASAALEPSTTGAVVFSGVNTQTINTTGGQTFPGMRLRNSAGLLLSSPVTVTGSLVTELGVLQTGAQTITLGPVAGISESASGYVTGNVAVTRTVAQNVTETFGGVGFAVRAAAAAPGLTTVVRTTGPAGLRTGFQNNPSIERSYNVTAAVPTGLDAEITLRWLNHELNGLPAELLAAYRSQDAGATWREYRPAARNTLERFVRLDNVDGFSIWTLGSFEQPLPVTLANLEARALAPTMAEVSWLTRSERGFEAFELERSQDGVAYQAIARVPAHGANQTYRHQDKSFPGRAYYRLRMIDRDGSEAFSKALFVRAGQQDSKVRLAVSPNPSDINGVVPRLVLEGLQGPAHLTLVTLEGRRIVTLKGDATTLEGPWNAAVSKLPAGVYMIRLQAEGLSAPHTLRLVRQ